LTRPRLSEISARLPLDGRAVAAAADIRAQAEIPDFRNRYDELAALRTAHQTPGGRESWVVVAPPLMGKSWLLARLEQALTTAEERWTVRHLDLRRAPLELRSNPIRLVGSLLDVDTRRRRSRCSTPPPCATSRHRSAHERPSSCSCSTAPNCSDQLVPRPHVRP
jgi:hypothetical protein